MESEKRGNLESKLGANFYRKKKSEKNIRVYIRGRLIALPLTLRGGRNHSLRVSKYLSG